MDENNVPMVTPHGEVYGRKVKGWLASAGLLERTTFTGMLRGEQKLAAFGDARVFVLPSYTENFGISVVEAMACEVPVVISDRVNLWREIAASGAGRVTPCDAKAVAESILELLANRPLAQKMGAQGLALVKERFQWDRVAGELEDAYRRIAGGDYRQLTDE